MKEAIAVPRVLSGQSRANPSTSIGIVVSRFNSGITQNLLDGALTQLAKQGIDESRITVGWVPGAWEIPLLVQAFVQTGGHDAVIALGAVIRGETTHDQYINHQVSDSLGRIALTSSIPVIFGLLTCQSLDQAIQRSGGNVGNKGCDCADAALEMIDVLSQLADDG